MAGWIATVMRLREPTACCDADLEDSRPTRRRPTRRSADPHAPSPWTGSAHDIYQDGRAPIEWNDVADAATIAALQMPGGFDFGSGSVFELGLRCARGRRRPCGAGPVRGLRSRPGEDAYQKTRGDKVAAEPIAPP